MSGRAKAELVFLPGPAIGHLVTTVELAKLIVDRDRDDGLSVTVLVMNLTDSSDLNSIKDSVSASTAAGRICFIELPQAELLGSRGLVNFMNAVESYKPHVRDVVRGLVERNPGLRLVGFMLDMFCGPMMDVANEFGVPSYLFYTSSASFLNAYLHIQALQEDHQQDISEIVESESSIDVPGLKNPLHVKRFMPFELRKKDVSDLFLSLGKQYKETKGIVVNTFEEVDQGAVDHFKSNDKLPTLYAVGPMLNPKGSGDSGDILRWLDDQPPESVVFLCFGSLGRFGVNQAREVARGLERTGHRFLWSLRLQPPESPLDEVLPVGFFDRTAGKGKVIGWAPQAEVLAHQAVGGFVSHCGWNSTLESIWFGVPMAAWPMYAEQHFNAFYLVNELEVAVEISMDYERDIAKGDNVLVTAEEIEKGITHLMAAEGAAKREKAKLLRDKSRKALAKCGTSDMNVGRFIADVYANMPE